MMDGELLLVGYLRSMGTGDLPFIIRDLYEWQQPVFWLRNHPMVVPTGSSFPSPILMVTERREFDPCSVQTQTTYVHQRLKGMMAL